MERRTQPQLAINFNSLNFRTNRKYNIQKKLKWRKLLLVDYNFQTISSGQGAVSLQWIYWKSQTRIQLHFSERMNYYNIAGGILKVNHLNCKNGLWTLWAIKILYNDQFGIFVLEMCGKKFSSNVECASAMKKRKITIIKVEYFYVEFFYLNWRTAAACI